MIGKTKGLRRAYPADATIGVWPARDGWPLRTFDWPATPDAGGQRGSLLFLPGRGDFFEKYLESLAHWHAAGWTIGAIDWRGQAGSGRLNEGATVGDIDDFGRYIADIGAYWAEWTARTPGPHVIVCHSMGGHLSLRAMAERAVTPDAAVLVAPMLGLQSPIGPPGGEWLARMMARLGNPARAAWKHNEKPHTTRSRRELLTHDQSRYDDEQWWQGEDARLFTGPPSWRWLAGAFASTRALRDSLDLAPLKTPVLMLVAEADRLVDPRAALAVAAQLPDVRVVRFGSESAHEILREEDRVRDRALAEIDAFLDERAARQA